MITVVVMTARSLETPTEESLTMLQKMRSHGQALGWQQERTCLLPSQPPLLLSTWSAPFSNWAPCPPPKPRTSPSQVCQRHPAQSSPPRPESLLLVVGVHSLHFQLTFPTVSSPGLSTYLSAPPITAQMCLHPSSCCHQGEQIHQMEHFAPISNHI